MLKKIHPRSTLQRTNKLPFNGLVMLVVTQCGLKRKQKWRRLGNQYAEFTGHMENLHRVRHVELALSFVLPRLSIESKLYI